MSDQTQNPTPSLPPVKLAFVLDGVVVDILHTDARLAAIFLSDPTVVDVTKEQQTLADGTVFTEASAMVGDIYDATTNTFTTPEAI